MIMVKVIVLILMMIKGEPAKKESQIATNIAPQVLQFSSMLLYAEKSQQAIYIHMVLIKNKLSAFFKFNL